MAHHFSPLMTSHLERVLAIEAQSFESPWTQEKFGAFMGSKTMVCLVMLNPDRQREVMGYVAFSVGGLAPRLLRLAVAPEYRLQRVGMALVEYAVNAQLAPGLKPQPGGPERVIADVPERCVAAQLFFRKLGFARYVTIKGAGGDVYRFSWAVQQCSGRGK